MQKSAHDRNRCSSTGARCLAAMINAALFAMIGATVLAKDASDGLVAWWRVESGENGAVFTTSDLRDHAHAGTTAAAVNHATTDGTYPAVPVCHTNIDLTYPMGSGTIPNAPCIYIPQPTNTSPTSGGLVANNQNVVMPLSCVDLSNTPGTFIIRFNPNSRIYVGRATPTVFSYDWSTTTGMKLSLRGQGSAHWTWPFVYFGNTPVLQPSTATWNIAAGDNIWYDVGVVIEPNVPEQGQSRVILYFCPGNGLTDQSANGNKVVAMTNTVSQLVSYGTLADRKLKLGSVNGSANWGGLSSDETLSSLLVHQVKVYNRALSSAEFEQACAPCSDPLFAVGSKNGSADEFSDSTAEAVYDADSMPWCKLRKTLTEANPSLSIRKSLSELDLTVPRILEFAPIYSSDCPQDAVLDVLVNGTMVERVFRNSESDRLVYISTNVLKRLTLVDDAYPLTLTLRRTGGMGGTVGFDRIMLGGGWQLGVRDRKYNEFMTWSGKMTYNFYRYFLARNNIKILADQMYGVNVDAKQASLTLCFSVSDALAANGEFVFRTRPLGNGTVDYYLNGDWLCTKTITSDADYELHFGIGSLRGGINELKATWTTTTDTSSRGFDYFRLTPKRFPRGVMIILR